MLRISLIAVFAAAAVTAYTAGPVGLGGSIVKADPDAKTFVVKGKDGETVVKYDEKTRFELVKPSDASVLTDGCRVKVNGKFSADQSAITATVLQRLADDFKSSAINLKESFCFGVFHQKGDQRTVTVGEKTIAITLSDKVEYQQRVAGSPADLEKGRPIWASVLPAEGGKERFAQSVIITSGTTPVPTKPVPSKPSKQTGHDKKQTATPPVPAPAAEPEKQPTGTISGTVAEVRLQDFVLKVAKGGDAKQVFAYNLTVLTDITVGGKPGKFEQIKKGMKVTVVSPDGKNAERIEAK